MFLPWFLSYEITIKLQSSRELKLKLFYLSGLWRNHAVWNGAGIKAWGLRASRQQIVQSSGFQLYFQFYLQIFGGPRLLGENILNTLFVRGLTTVAEWGQWSCRSTWGEEDKIIIIISNSKGVHWGFINAHPYLHRINTRKKWQNFAVFL